MKVLFAWILILLFPLMSFSQLNSAWDLLIGYNHTFRYLETSCADEMVIEILEKRDIRESGKFNWNAGIHYNLKLRDNIFLKSGINLASLGYKGENQKGLRWASEIDASGVWHADPDLPHEIQFIYDYWFLEIPIGGRLELFNAKFTPFVELGLVPAIYLMSQTKSITDLDTDMDYHDDSIQNFNKVQIGSYITLGATTSIIDQIQIFVQARVKYYHTKLVDSEIGEYLYSSGIELGIRKRI